jgi:hypothetical protein
MMSAVTAAFFDGGLAQLPLFARQIPFKSNR